MDEKLAVGDDDPTAVDELPPRYKRKTIGQINGPWAILLKVMLASYIPLMGSLLTWGIWITSETYANQYFRLQGARVTPAELRELERRFEARFNALPPQDWRTRITTLESQQQAMFSTLIRIETKLDHQQ